MTGQRTATVVALLAACGSLVVGQQPSPTPFRVASELVVVDLVATTRDGRFVEDLLPSDIQVSVDGHSRAVQFLRLVESDNSGAGAFTTETDATRGAALTRVPKSEPVRVAVVVDLVSTSAEDLLKVQDAIVGFVQNELPPRTEVMVVSLNRGVKIERQFTADKEAVVATVRALRAAAAGRIGFLEIIDNAMRDCASGGAQVVFPALVVAGKTYIQETRLDLAFSSAALSTLTASLGRLPGRKHIVLYSRGYPLDPVPYVIEVVASVASACGGGTTDYRSKAAEALAASDEGSGAGSPFRTAIDRANRAQVSFYTVDARSLFVTSVQSRDSVAARATRRGLITQVLSTEASLPQEYLRSLAADTGGRSFLNSNDLTPGLRRAWTDASRYYLIGFTPDPHRKKGEYHRIEVKVTRADLDLRFRRGYYDSTEQEVADADVSRALSVPGAYERAGLEVEAVMQADTLRVIAFLPPADVRFEQAGDRSTATIRLHGALRDAKGKLVGNKNLFDREITLRLTAAQLSHLTGSDNIEIPIEVALPKPGTYSMTIAARASGGWMGTQIVPLTVK